MANKRWTQKEIEILKEYYPLFGTKYTETILKKEIPGFNRSYFSIKNKAVALKIKFYARKWSKEEIQIIHKYYIKEGLRKTENRLKELNPNWNRGKNALATKIKELGIKREAFIRWSQEENDIIKEYYPVGGAKFTENILKEKIPGCKRKANAIKGQAIKLKIKSPLGMPSKILTDNYVRSILLRKGFENDQITPEIIDLHRHLYLLNRAIKKHGKTN